MWSSRICSLILLAHILNCWSAPTTQQLKPKPWKPTMVGEPLNPFDFENGFKLVIDKELAKNMTINDGTINDIIEPKPSLLRDAHSKLWPNGTIPYLLDSNFTESDRAMVAKAIQLIEAKTCIRIIPRTSEENYVLLKKNSKDRTCASGVGMYGGKQEITLAERCIIRFGSTSHELMHAIGFYHEQSRPDRDDYVIIRYENIAENYKGQFRKVHGEYANLAGGYDIKSITHYGNGADSKNGKHTMDPKDKPGELGQREYLTKLDIEKVNNYYSCDMKSKSSDTADDNSDTVNNSTQLNTNRGIIPFLCIDLDPTSCQKWAKHGYCEQSPLFMTVYCKATCKKCDSGCVDMSKKCKEWTGKKYCKKYWHYMYQYCPVSCKTCPVSTGLLTPPATAPPPTNSTG